ncbi:MAG: CHASE3 domain-containing protein [Terriglobia bacterium]|jgi:PAS domain S-box-containing protein
MLSRQKLLHALPAIERYALTVLAVVCTVAIRLVFEPALANRAPYLFFVLTIVIVKRLWGRGPGLLATLLGGIAVWYFIIEPQYSFAVANRVDMLNLAAYFAVGASISLLGEMSRHLPASIAIRDRRIKPRVIRQTAVLAGAALVLTGMVLLLLHDFERTQEAEGWVVHTYRVIHSAESVMSMMKDAEAGERGFILTGDESYLGPYNLAIAALPNGLKELKDLTSDNPPQQARWVEIDRLTGERLRVLKHAIELRKVSKVDEALALVRYGRGEPSMDELRSTLDAVMSEERQLLVERTAEAERRASRGRWALGLGSGALVLLLVFASVVIERETVRREEITQALRRHADLLEQAHDSLMTCRLGGAIDYWSRGAETLYGYSREEALGRISHELLQTSHPLGMAQIDALLERDGHWKGELNQTTKDGRKLIVEGQWTLAVDAEGNKTVLKANRDITERKQSDDALRQSEEHFRFLFDNMLNGYAYCRMLYQENHPCDFIYLNVNKAFEVLTGLKNVEGKKVSQIIPGIQEADPELIETYGRVASTGVPERFETYVEALAMWFSIAVYSPKKEHFVAVFDVITERKRAEEALHLLNVELEERVRSRTAALEAANRELEAFAHSVSHDLRAPLRGIDGWSLALLEDCGDRLDAQGHKYLERVRSEAQRMGGLIDDLLHLSRVGRTELVPSTVDLTCLAATIVARLKEAHPDRSIEFIVAPQLKCTGDARLLEIALTNLLANAVKFTGPRSPARIEFGQTTADGGPAFFVRDNGVGFDMAYAGMLFAPFQRLHKTSEFPGSGIGLATVQRVIHRHGGRIWADARVGEGATLYFTLGENKA